MPQQGHFLGLGLAYDHTYGKLKRGNYVKETGIRYAKLR